MWLLKKTPKDCLKFLTITIDPFILYKKIILHGEILNILLLKLICFKYEQII